MTTATPLFSFVTCAYQSEPFVRRCYASLVLQTITDWEWVIVDDASRDQTSAVLESIGDPRIRVVRLAENQGRGRARQVGLDAARGRWTAIVDVDDFCLPDRLERAARVLEAGSDFYCSSLVLVDDDYRITGIRPADLGGLPRKFPHATLCGPTGLIRRIGYTSDRSGEDVRLVLTLANHYSGYYDVQPAYVYHEGASTSVGGAIRGKYASIKVILRDATLRRTPGVARLIAYEAASLLALCPMLLVPRFYGSTLGFRARKATVMTDLHPEHRAVILSLSHQFPNVGRTVRDSAPSV